MKVSLGMYCQDFFMALKERLVVFGDIRFSTETTIISEESYHQKHIFLKTPHINQSSHHHITLAG